MSTGGKVSPETLSDVVILDFDGTIVDSMPFLTDTAASLITARYGVAGEEARKSYIETTGLPFSRQIEIMFPGDARNAETVRAFEQAKRSRLLEFDLFPDVAGVVRQIREHGLKVCVSSGNKEELIAELLRSRRLDLDLIMGYRPGFMKGPDHFAFAMKHFGTACENLLFVGDSRHDAESAVKAGIRFVARTGLHSRSDLENMLPGIAVIENLEQLLPLVGINMAREGKTDRAASRANQELGKRSTTL